MKYTVFALSLLLISLVMIVQSYLNEKKHRSEIDKKKSTVSDFVDTCAGLVSKYYMVILFLVFVVFLVSRLVKLESFPNGFHVDELSMAIDSKMLHYHGTDRHGVRWPAYFFNYGGGQNALSIYINSFLYYFMPTTLFTMRIMAVVWGALLYFAMYGICYELTEDKTYSLIGPILVTVLPVCIMSERWGLESYVLLPMCTYAMYFIICALKRRKIKDFIIAGCLIGFSMYTYAVAYIVWPIFIILTAAYLIYLKKITVKETLALIIPMGIISMPVFVYQLVNEGFIPPFSIWISDYFPLPIPRESDMGFQYVIENFAFIKLLFLGGEELTYNSFKEFGTIYMFLLPLVFIGFVMNIRALINSIKKREYDPMVLFLFFLIGSIAFTMILRGPNVNRCNELFLPFMVYIFVAFYKIFKDKHLFISIFGMCTAASFLFFMYFYFVCQNDVYGYHPMYTSASPYKAVEKVKDQYMYDENTIIYVFYEDGAISPGMQAYYFWGSPEDSWTEAGKQYGNIILGFPEEFDENENAIYILDNENRGHIISYLTSVGYSCDTEFPGYSILYKNK